MPTLSPGQWTTALTTNSVAGISSAMVASSSDLVTRNSLTLDGADSKISLGKQTINEEAIADWYNAARLLKALMQRSKLEVIVPDTILEDRHRELRAHFENWLHAIAIDMPADKCNILAARYNELATMYKTYEAITETK